MALWNWFRAFIFKQYLLKDDDDNNNKSLDDLAEDGAQMNNDENPGTTTIVDLAPSDAASGSAPGVPAAQR